MVSATATLAAHLSPITDVWIEEVGKYAPHDDITPSWPLKPIWCQSSTR